MSDAVITNNVRSLNYTYFNDYYKQTILNKQSPMSGGVNDIEFNSSEKDEEKFWLPLRRFNSEADRNVEAGQVLCSLRIYPKVHAEKSVQGEGR
jgi:hypothetical protein